MQTLINEYARAGILQLGRFQQPDGSFHPLSANFLMLPSYPALMRKTAQALVPMLHSTHADRLLTTRAAIPLGAVLAVESDIPLTYPYGEAKDYTIAYTIEGAYDVGHPTTLLIDVLTTPTEAMTLIKQARQVGLVVQQVIAVLALGRWQEPTIGFHALFDFDALVAGLADRLTEELHDQLRKWHTDYLNA